jgi:uncharacterized coiled-coil protein SlyX
MAQIIKHRRGSLESLSTVTGSLQKGEIVIASGSSNLSVTNGSSIVFAVPENGQVQAVNRILVGANAPNTFAAGTYNGMLKGVPYYASGSSTLYLLGEGANEIPDLTGNISNFSSSVATSINALSSSIGSGAIGTSVAALNTFSGSTIVSLSALNSFSSSQLEKDSTLGTYTGSVETRLTEVGVVTASLFSSASAAKSTNDTQDGRLTNLELTSASVNTSIAALNSSTASQQTSIDALNSYTSSNTSTNALNAFTASAETRFTEIGVVSASLFTSASTAKTTNDAQDDRLTAIESFSGSQLTQNTALATVTGSLITSASNAAIAIANLNANSGSYAILSGSNVFYGQQTITGSLYVTQDLIVQGSSSLQYITASAVDLGTNTIILNNDSPAVRFGGISVVDSGSASGASGSLFWDSLNNNWIYQHPSGGAESGQTAILISGPRNSGSMGSEAHITPGKIMVAVGDDHIGDSIITQATDNSAVSIAGNVIVTGSLTVGTLNATNGIVSGSSQITISDTTGYGDFSGSISASLQALSASVGSGAGVSIANLNTFSASVLTQLTEIGVVTASLFSSASTAKSTNDTQDGRLSNLETTSASVNISVSALNSSTASQQTQIDGLSAKTGSYATTGSNVFVGTQTISASFNVSGSSNFNGAVAVNDSNVNLTNSSSLNLTAGSSIYVNGAGVISGSIVGIGNVTAFSTSVDSRLDTLESAIGEGSNIDARLDNLETTSASVNVSVTNINSFSSSVLTRLTEIGVVSGSLFASASTAKSTNDTQDGRLSNLETTSASVNTSVSNLNSKSASVDVSIANINSFTSSFGTTFSSSVDSRLDTLEGTGTIQGLGTENNVTFAKVTTTGDVVVGGDLVVQGNTVTLNTATLVVEDKLITLASGSTSSATADGAGFEVAGASANFVYQHSTTSFTSSVALIAPAVTASVNLGTSAGNTKRIAFRNTNGNLNLVPTASVAGDLLQWDGTDFVMSNVVDGGSF